MKMETLRYDRRKKYLKITSRYREESIQKLITAAHHIMLKISWALRHFGKELLMDGQEN